MLEDPFEFTASNCDRPPSRSTSAQRAGGVSATSVPSGHESRSVAWRFVATAKCYRPAQADTTAPSFGRRDQGSWTSVGGAATVESESSFLQVVWHFFIYVAKKWLRFSGMLTTPPVPRMRFALSSMADTKQTFKSRSRPAFFALWFRLRPRKS